MIITCAGTNPHNSIEAYFLSNIVSEVIQKLLAIQIYLKDKNVITGHQGAVKDFKTRYFYLIFK